MEVSCFNAVNVVSIFVLNVEARQIKTFEVGKMNERDRQLMEIEYKYRRRPDLDMSGPAPDIGWGEPVHILRQKARNSR